MSYAGSKLTRVGVFYDGNYFSHVSNYYYYHHGRRARINVSGLHEFIRHQVAESEGYDVKYCQIVDAHYFRGRHRAQDAEQRGVLLRERLFDDVLIREGVVTHYLPLGRSEKGIAEKGIDVWLALEAFELAIYKRFDVSVLVAGDGDFLPLVRKLNTLGARVMLLGWDFEYTDQDQHEQTTRTNQFLLDEVTYPVMMHQVIEDRSRRTDSLVNNLFVTHKELRAARSANMPQDNAHGSESFDGKIQLLKEGYGFIAPLVGGTSMFFFYADVVNAEFNDLKIGDRVRYKVGRNAKGACAVGIELIPV